MILMLKQLSSLDLENIVQLKGVDLRNAQQLEE